ncbi:MAG: hypothetical protein LC737_08675 [Chloroflexi bacterium]|nr:hypothetical protein [Chloroflexota bacterium]
MKRHVWRTCIVHSALLFALCFYLLLPALGTAWHAVVPEHDHWLLHAGSLSDRTWERGVSAALDRSCSRCVLSSSTETLVHALTPFAGLQLMTLLVGLSPVILLVAPLGRAQPIVATKLFLLALPLTPPDPPPMA